jgi:hypothetical protein
MEGNKFASPNGIHPLVWCLPFTYGRDKFPEPILRNGVEKD